MKLQKTISYIGVSVIGAVLMVQAPAIASQPAIQPKKMLIAPEVEKVLNHISANTMRGNLQFLASDLLEGRDTPSRGLDLAADYIAAQFQIAGLEPAGEKGYFQTVDWNTIKPAPRVRPGAPVPEVVAIKEPQAPAYVRNVIGVLRGSDPVLKDSYILVTAHYDHVGIKKTLQGEQIFNGANDDASGVVSVIELARAFASMKVRPKRSIVFMTFFGEEKGLVGSRYYGKNPIFPISKTIAGINIEQVGRTDDNEGPQVASVGVTGFDFSDVGTLIEEAGKYTGIRAWKHPVNSDKYFGASDNQALADHGIPAHTISVAYGFPDYHAPGDDSDKIDYDNMAKVNRAVALAVARMANRTVVPMWNESNPKAAKYFNIWKARQPK